MNNNKENQHSVPPLPNWLEENIRKEFEVQGETEKLNEKLPEIVEEINGILEEYGVFRKLLPSDVMFGKKHFGNRFSINQNILSHDNEFAAQPTLSDILFDFYYPKPTGDRFYHFTTLEAAIKIVESRHFRLTNLTKNYDYGEFRPFYEQHNLHGYEQNVTPNGDLFEDYLMNQTFALCLTNKQAVADEQERYLWEVFAEDKAGVALEFQVTTTHPDFREILYDNRKEVNGLKLINALTAFIENRFGRQFTFSKVSKFGGFYLPSTYEIETETRFLIKEHTDDYPFNFQKHPLGGAAEYIELPFESRYGEFALKRIILGDKCPVGIAEQEFTRLNLDSLIVYPS